MTLVTTLTAIAAPWAARYNDSTSLQDLVLSVHLGGMLLGGGLAVSTDRAMLHALCGDAAPPAGVLRQIAGAHRTVLAGLAAVMASGALLFLSDVKTFVGSPTFWIKMALIAALLVNGAVMRGAERRLGAGFAAAGGMLRRTAGASLALWFLTLIAGVVLVNAG